MSKHLLTPAKEVMDSNCLHCAYLRWHGTDENQKKEKQVNTGTIEKTEKELRKRRRALREEAEQLFREERELLEQEKKEEGDLAALRSQIKDADYDTSFEDFGTLEARERFFVDHLRKIGARIHDIRARRRDLSIEQQMNNRAYFVNLWESTMERFAAKSSDEFFRILALTKLAGGLPLDALVTRIFRLNNQDVNEKVKVVYAQLSKEHEE